MTHNTHKFDKFENSLEDSIRFYESELPKDRLERARIAENTQIYIDFLQREYKLYLEERG